MKYDKDVTIPKELLGKVCMNCLEIHDSLDINTIEIAPMGYGSQFDNESTKMQLCNDCYKATPEDWWKLETHCNNEDYDFYQYVYEREILDYAGKMPLLGRELFSNRYSHGAGSGYMNDAPEMWIKMMLGTMTHDESKEWGMYSNEEITAYEERFPKCWAVSIEKFDDGSAHTKCFYGAYGSILDGNAITGANVSDECFLCTHFDVRKDEIETVYADKVFRDNEIERYEYMIEYAQDKLDKLKDPE